MLKKHIVSKGKYSGKYFRFTIKKGWTIKNPPQIEYLFRLNTHLFYKYLEFPGFQSKTLSLI